MAKKKKRKPKRQRKSTPTPRSALILQVLLDEAKTYAPGSEIPETVYEKAHVWFDALIEERGPVKAFAFVEATLKYIQAGKEGWTNEEFILWMLARGRAHMIQHIRQEAPGLHIPQEEVSKAHLEMIDVRHNEEATLHGYRQLADFMMKSAREKHVKVAGPTGIPNLKDDKLTKLGSADANSHRRMASYVYNKMRVARVFSFTPYQFAQVYSAADLYTTEDIAGFDYKAYDGSYVPKEEQEQHIVRVTKAGERWPFPEKLPFDTIYLGLGQGMPLSDTQAAIRLKPQQLGRMKQTPSLLGYLLTRDGLCVEFVHTIEDVDGEEISGVYFTPKHVSESFAKATGGRNHVDWVDAYDLSPWIVQGLVGSINWHNTLVVEGKNRMGRYLRGGSKGGIRHIPPPYYVVTIKSRTFREDLTKGWKKSQKRELHYQHDRRGHYRIKVYRGPKPLDEKTRKKFQRRAKKCKGDLQIWEARVPSDEVKRCLAERGHAPKSPDEWMVTIVTWIDDMLVPANPAPGVPYVPSIRKVPAVKEKAVR